jgi:hypothetical protein
LVGIRHWLNAEGGLYLNLVCQITYFFCHFYYGNLTYKYGLLPVTVTLLCIGVVNISYKKPIILNIATMIELHGIDDTGIVEIISDDIIIHTAQDGLDLLGDAYYQGYDKMILHMKNITPLFFDLKNGLAGEILQKFSNYRVRLVVLGDFSKMDSKSLNDFIRESNNGKLINFLNSKEEAIYRLSVM